MEKKNPYKFTLGFDKTKPSHVRATEILNSVKDKADLIASALVSYIDDVRQEEGAVLSNEALQVLMQEMVKQEVAKAMHLHSIKPEEPNRNSNSVMAVQQESLETITPEVAKSVRDDIRFDLESFYGGLHCGECFDVKVKDIWIPVRIEMGDDWYLVGLNVSRLDGLRVRM